MEEVVGSIPTRSTKNALKSEQLGARPGSPGRSSVRSRPGPPKTRFSMYTVYILRSQSSGRFYIGCTANLVQRLAEHQRGQTASTRNRGPWLLVYEERFETLAEARGRERQLKSWKSHRSIRELLKSQQLGARPGPPGRSSVRSRPGPPKTLAKLLFTSFRASLAPDSMPPVLCRRVCNAGNGHRK